jgi:hypothetical protein
MEAVKQIIKIPKNHELRIKVPQSIPEDSSAEVIIIVDNNTKDYNKQINLLKEAVKDPLYLNDLKNTLEEFSATECERLE